MSTIIEFKNVNKEYKSGDHILKAMDKINTSKPVGRFGFSYIWSNCRQRRPY